jgi:beta-phosphoglucomutase-like phosphatase (HAD superfamily)
MSTGNSAADRKAALRAELDVLRSSWREALLAASDALQADKAVLPAEELAAHQRHLKDEYETAAAGLRQFARDEGLSAELAVPFLPRGHARRALGLPNAIEACVFELDDVLVASSALHGEAWSRAFNELLASRSETTFDRKIEPDWFDPSHDYRCHVEGVPRLEGIRAFLASRGIRLPEGGPDDPAGAETVHGIANRKQEFLGALLERDGVRAYEGARHYLEVARDAHMRCAVVSASTHTNEMLERSGLSNFVAASIDADAMGTGRLRNYPAPDTLLAACRKLRVDPQSAAAFETSQVGIDAARAAHFGYVVAIDLRAEPGRLRHVRRAGASVTVTGLAELMERSG